MTSGSHPTSDSLTPLEGVRPARLIVCESTGAWAVALRRELASAGFRVHETRSVAQCWELLGRSPASFLVVELTRGSAEALLARLAGLERDYPHARVAVVAARPLQDCEWAIREAGVVHFTTSPRQLAPLAHLAQRHLEMAPKPSRSLTERIWASLPWRGPE